jgi:50S ribosomal protein L16 3-hydroxylase
VDSARLRRWFGAFITRYRAAHEAAPAPRPMSADQVATRLARGRALRNPWSRFAWARDGRRAELFVAGERYACTPALAQALNAIREFDGAELLRLARSLPERTLLATLVNAGHLHLLRTR